MINKFSTVFVILLFPLCIGKKLPDQLSHALIHHHTEEYAMDEYFVMSQPLFQKYIESCGWNNFLISRIRFSTENDLVDESHKLIDFFDYALLTFQLDAKTFDETNRKRCYTIVLLLDKEYVVRDIYQIEHSIIDENGKRIYLQDTYTGRIVNIFNIKSQEGGKLPQDDMYPFTTKVDSSYKLEIDTIQWKIKPTLPKKVDWKPY